MALGVAFGLSCSLMLKHSRLSSYPPLESCLVTLVAYTSYFFSNGVTMSGIVSLLFCGITLKHYAYHNMSRHTQRATRYIFQTLANLSENFIFIYLGLSLFTQDQLVYKPLFIIVTVAAVVLSRYSAVFPIAAVVNSVKRARLRRRSQRAGPGSLREGNKGDEELPREYQIMLFWAGLRGAVGFALSAGIEGHNAPALQTTVLVAVVLTVIVFGGTTAQMLDILGIRTGVEDDEGDSTDEEEEAEIAALRLKSVRRRKRMVSGNGHRSAPEAQSLFRDEEADMPEHTNSWQTKNPYPDGDSLADDHSSSGSSTEVLPNQGHSIYPSDGSTSMSRRSREYEAGSEEDNSVRKFLDRAGLIMRDGRWFSTLDQRYLTPMFTNSVASRKHEERKAMRRSEVALAAAEGSSVHLAGGHSRKASASGGSSRNSVQYDGAGARSLGAFDERDADVLDEEDDDDDGAFVRSLDGSSTSLTALGASAPTRRTNSRTASDDESKGNSAMQSSNTGTSPASRMTGAFAPFSAEPPKSARNGNGEFKQRTSDDLGPL
jgi:sodium/hydrogen exchanger-like protein 6/7